MHVHMFICNMYNFRHAIRMNASKTFKCLFLKMAQFELHPLCAKPSRYVFWQGEIHIVISASLSHMSIFTACDGR